MGVYLSSPVTEKESVDEECDDFSYGASSMQGWRINQEDAHNCIPDFDPETKTSFFAVYDGHGGPEVAKYCERHFPEFVKMLIESQKDNENSEKIIKSAFLAFDSTLIQDEVIKELKVLAGKDDEDEEIDEEDPVGRTETDRLKEEADMPLDELLAKYGRPVEDGQSKIQGNEDDEPGSSKEPQSSSKRGVFVSPALRSKSVSRTASRSSQKEDAETDLPSSTTADTVSNSDPSSSLSSSSSSLSSENKKTCVANSVSNGMEANGTASTKKGEKSSRVSDANGQTNNNNIDKSSCESNSGAKNTKSGSSCAKDDCSHSALPESSSRTNETCGSSSGSGSCSGSGSGSSSAQDQVSSSTNSNIKPILDGDMSSSDDDDEEEDAMWQDMSDDSDDDDDEEEDNESDQDVPQMDMTNEEPGSDSGCTACICLLQGKRVIVANAGDSRCVLSRSGVAVELSFDHKPEDDPERERIEKAGGKVTSDGRVNGGLNLSRAIGDHVYKRNKELPAKDQMITSLPDIETAELTDDDQFIVIACDGIWNYMSSQEVIDYVSQKLNDPEKRKKPSLVCEELFDHCLAPNTYGDGTGCDNMTCIIVVFNSMKSAADIKTSTGEPITPTGEPITPTGEPAPTESKSESLKRGADDGGDGQEKRLKHDDVA